MGQHNRKFAALAAAAFSVVALGACGTGDSSSSASGDSGSGSSGEMNVGPGVDAGAKTITVGNVSALSGPGAALGKPVTAGTQSYFEQLNAKGGIDGWKVNLESADGKYEAAAHVRAFSGLVPKSAVMQSTGSPTTKAIQGRIDQEKILTVPLSWDSLWGDDPNMAPVGTSFAVDTANALQYVAKDRGGDGAAIIYQNDESGHDALRGYEQGIKTYGLRDLGRVSYKVGDTDFTAQVQKLKRSGARYVVLTGLPSGSPAIVATAASLGYTPTWLFMGSAYIEQLMTKDGTVGAAPTPVAKALAKDTLVMSVAGAWGDKDAAAMPEMLQAHRRYAPDQNPTVYFTYGYAQGRVIAEILRKAIESKDLSRAGIVKAKTDVGHIDLGGLAPDPTYGSGTRAATLGSTIGKIDPKVEGFLRPVAKVEQGEAAGEL
ncbi:MAG: hypothetical protein JWN65_414 [Solirubrobacterales bacterium]|nr:hypothetical protein [Solirubrobacterales bacterium]